MSKVTFSFASGKHLTVETLSDGIAEFFDANQNDSGKMTGWLLFSEGYAVKVDNVDWILVEGEDA